MLSVVQGILPCVLSYGIGMALRGSICTEVDGMTLRRLALYATLPSLVLQTCITGFTLTPSQVLLTALLYSASVILPGIISWASTRYLHPKERGVLAGMSLGSSMELFALPLVCLCCGQEALHAGMVCLLVNLVATHVLAPLYFSTAGPAFPKNFQHTDGGVYNGEWKGALKDGFGVYTYPSGAVYAGEWLDGTKEGRGVYSFAKGGVYEGEWRNGRMEGVGVRTYSTGKVSAGVWEAGRLVKSVDESQCALVVANANEAALVARRVFVGPIGMDEILRNLISQPVVWACVAAGVMMVLGKTLSPLAEYATVQLSKAHAPLALLSMGMLFDTMPVETRQIPTATSTLATRIVPGFLLYSVAAFLVHSMGGTLLTTSTIVAMALATASPLSSRCLELAHLFRLNENVVAATTRYSFRIAIPIACGVLFAAHQNSLQTLSVALALAPCILWFLSMLHSTDDGGSTAESDFYKRTIRMVYKGPRSSANDGQTRPGQASALANRLTMPTPCRPPRLVHRRHQHQVGQEPVESEPPKWFGMPFDDCQRMVDYAKRREPMVKFMLDKIAEAGCTIDGDFIKVQHCNAEVGGGFRAPDGVILCHNHLGSQEEVTHALTHELVHAYDHCRAKDLDWCNCTHHACSEIRAASLSGDCNYKMEMLRGHFKVGRQHQACVKRRALLSVKMNPYCQKPGQAEKAVEEAFAVCFEDTAPFDRRP